jgi:glycolate oxidase iron-sulfur subunit
VSGPHPLADEMQRLLACVHCGFCLQSCPTYTRLGDEADSPRGRLVLMRAVAEGRIDPDADALAVHLDRCLGCRACETACPAGVQYGHLLERARGVVARARGTPISNRLLLGILARPVIAAPFLAGTRLLRASRLPSVMLRLLPRRWARVRLALAMVASTRAWNELRGRARGPVRNVAAEQAALGREGVGAAAAEPTRMSDDNGAWTARPTRPLRVGVLLGCVQDGLFRRVNQATVRVLGASGCEVVEVEGQRCCGALHAHAGDLNAARALARENLRAFGAADVDIIAVNAAGCGSAMKEYGELFEGQPEHAQAEAFARRVRDINELLAELEPTPRRAVELRVTYDAPCHLHHAQRITRAPLELLGRIPGVQLVPLPGAEECCGGAGTYGLMHPELGGRILEDKIRAVLATGADVVATPNPGCMMQIGAGLQLAGASVGVVHPIEILDAACREES